MLHARRPLVRPKKWMSTSALLVVLILLLSFVQPATADSSWQVVSTLSEPLFALTAASAANNLYVLGGTDHTNCSNIGQQTVERAIVNGDGSLSPWTATSAMLIPRSNHAVVAVGNRLYALGGVNNCSLSDTTDSVEWVLINTDGSLGTWQTTSSMTTRRLYLGAVAVNGYLYAIGGAETNPTPLSTVERAAINLDGSLGPWQATSSLLTARSSLATAAWGIYIYAVGGSDGSALNTVERAEVQPDGSLGPWQLVSSMTTARYGLTAVVLDGYLYALGGQDNVVFDIVERAAINPDGSLGAWETISTMTSPRTDHAAVAANGRIYAIGGYSGREQGTAILLDSVEVWEPPSEVVNQPPTCSSAYPSIATLWPPNHQFVTVNILGVTDPDGNTTVITIDSIFQDEAVNAKGSGNTAPDGQGVGTATADVRAERVGSGNGRVYHIRFTADDGQGGTCSGEVLVGVPKSQGKKDTPVNDGPLHDSTALPGSDASRSSFDIEPTHTIFLPLTAQ